MSDLVEASVMSTSASAFNLLLYVVLIEGYRENPTSHTHTSLEKNSLTAFSDNCRCSSLTVCKSAIFDSMTSPVFIKVSCSVESEITLRNFSYFVIVNSVSHFVFLIDLLAMHDFFFLTLHIGHLEDTSSVSFADL